jgi:hypothetical protein
VEYLGLEKSGGDWIRGGKGRESLGKSLRSGGGTPNRLLVALAADWKGVDRRKSLNEGSKHRSKGYIPRGLDLSSGTPDQTCPVGNGFSDLE